MSKGNYSTSQEQIIQAIKDYKVGKSTIELGKELNVHNSTISIWLKRAGVVTRKYNEKEIDWDEIRKEII